MTAPVTCVYISGPMTGIKDENRPAFRQAAGILRDLGFTVLSPDELDNITPVRVKTWSNYMRRDLPALAQADACYCLPGWRMSQGATLEVTVLAALGAPIWEFDRHWSARRLLPQELPHPVHPVPERVVG